MQQIADIASYPIQAIGEAVGSVRGDPRPSQRSSLFNRANSGPAETAAIITGVSKSSMLEDDAPYFTNNDGIPWADPTHSKTIGGIPLLSDTFLLQKQQTFNRSKNLDRMVHPCKYRVERSVVKC